jgi:RNase P/RNase MRP subunit p30
MMDINLFRLENSIYLKKIGLKSDLSDNDDCGGYLIKGSEKEARRIIASLKDKKVKKLIGFVGGDDAFNRRAIESLKIDFLVSPERSPLDSKYRTGQGRKVDSLKQRDSGINHVVAKLAREKNVKIVVDFGEISKMKGKEKALRIGRIIQNVKVCRRAKCDLKIASFGKSEKDLIGEKERVAFGVSLGMSSAQARDCVLF